MSFSYTYLTRRQFLMNYRDAIGVSIIASFFASKLLRYVTTKSDNEWTLTQVYTDDETDVHYRDVNNKSDAAVKREIITKFAKQVRDARAAREREMQLDAYNYLNGKNHTLE
jgi:hypothetical protein